MDIKIHSNEIDHQNWFAENKQWLKSNYTFLPSEITETEENWRNIISFLREEDITKKVGTQLTVTTKKKSAWISKKFSANNRNYSFDWMTYDRENLATAIENYLNIVAQAHESNGVLNENQEQQGSVTNNVPQQELEAAHEVPAALPRNLILQGAPGTGKTHLARQLAHWLIKKNKNKHPIPSIDDAIGPNKKLNKAKDQVNADLKGSKHFKMVQFHPATSYEDFVRGIRAKTKENSETKENSVTYEVEHGHLSEMCKEAAANPTKNYVLLIDEINRANLPAVLGECIFALEYRGQAVDTAYEIEGNKKLTIPENLWIIGTMNTADRSVGHLDYAIRRRFLFVDCLGDAGKVVAEAKNTFEEINGIIKEYRSEEFEAKDIQIGHTYFMEADWETRLQYQVKPILEEYLRDGVLKPSAKDAVAGL